MRVAIIITSLHSGGAERVTAHLANAWAALGWEISVITLARKELDFYQLHTDIDRLALDLSGDSRGLIEAVQANVRRVVALRCALRAFRPDTVVAMMTSAGVLATLATRGLNCRVIVSERIYPPLYPLGWIWNLLRRVAYRRACRVVMLTREGLNWLEKEIPGAKGAVIPNPAIYPLPLGEPVLRPVQILASERKLLLAVGRLDEGKQFDCLLDAFATLAIRHPSWDLVILGEGPERAGLEQQIAALGLQRRASLPGRAGNMGDWYGRADLYVMSSRFEGFPNTLTEAMAHGCAAVSYDCDTGPRDLIRHEVDGLLVAPVGDVPALTEALDRLMGDEGERTRMASRALEVRERYSMEKIIAMWDATFDGDSSLNEI